ncbi:uncharacterized protein EAE97_011060 [Botrytis byssoidea]|uniref:Secreted protein n=1 Tax=Botrytis byssoidea TaxID=139641 RepID=A0A9P5LIB8_9HELO|nr:uncharacterized protein EAE97_011060 [Botrytis byssoidea]KAF7922318.1 hypothetical protein EAE97_011060 [Botrytis byssoidea]
MTANKHVKHLTWHLSLLSSYFLVTVDPLDNILSNTARQRRTQGGWLASARYVPERRARGSKSMQGNAL